MHDNESFRLIDPDLAVGIVCAGVAAAAILGAFPEPRVAKAATPIQCQVTVAQYGAGERWVMLPREPRCAGRMVPAPNHILASPL